MEIFARGMNPSAIPTIHLGLEVNNMTVFGAMTRKLFGTPSKDMVHNIFFGCIGFLSPMHKIDPRFLFEKRRGQPREFWTLVDGTQQ